MSKKREKKMDLKSAILLLLLLLALLVSSTYAWFTANRVVTVSNIKVKIEATNGIQISANAVDWKTDLSTTDLTNANETQGILNLLPDSIEPVSTVGEVDSSTGYMKMYYGSVDSDAGELKLTATAIDETTSVTTDTTTNLKKGKFIAFDVFLRVTSDQPNVMLGYNSNVSMNSDTTLTNTGKGIENASRVAFLNQGNMASDSAATDIIALHGASSLSASKLGTEADTGATYTYFWEPNMEAHTTNSVANAQATYYTDETKKTKITVSSTEVTPYNGISEAFTDKIPVSELYYSTAHFSKVSTIKSTLSTMKATESDVNKFFSLSAGITKMRIYMWIEGQDIDCEDNASGENIVFNLEFKVPANS